MTGNQASPARAALPAPQAAAAHSHDPAGDHAIGCRPAHLPLAAVPKKTARYAPVLLGGAAAAVLAMAVPAMASPISGHDATSTGSISTILNPGDIVTGVRATGNGRNVILTGAETPAGSNLAMPFLYQGPLTPAAKAATLLHPPFPGGIKTATFYGPDTPYYNPETIPAGQVRAVGSYQTMTTPSGGNSGVMNHGMIYLGPVSGSGGQWTSIDVPADGSNTVGHVRACPITRPNCFVMEHHRAQHHGRPGGGQLRPQPRRARRSDLRQRLHLQHVHPSVDAAAPRRKPVQRDHAVRHLAERRARQPELHPGRRLLGARLLARNPAGLPDELQRTDRRLRAADVLQLRQRPGGGYALRRDHEGAGRFQPRGRQLGSAVVHGVRPDHRRQLAFLRHRDVVSHRCRGKPGVLRGLHHR